VVTVLVDDLTEAIPSLLGLNLTDHPGRRHGHPQHHRTGCAGCRGASLHVPLDELTAAGLGSAITFYAARAVAFVDLAADIRYAYGLDRQVVVDGHHQPDQPGHRGAHRAGMAAGDRPR